MITITEKERNDMVASAEATMMVKTKKALCGLKSGDDIGKYAVDLSSALCSFVALSHYSVNGFTPESYFNIINPDDAFGIFSVSNTVNVKIR